MSMTTFHSFSMVGRLLDNMLHETLNAVVKMAEAHEGGVWEEFLSIATDPAHLLFELLFSLIFDVLIVSFVYGILIKKFIIPKLRREIHKEIDEEHGYIEHEKPSDS